MLPSRSPPSLTCTSTRASSELASADGAADRHLVGPGVDPEQDDDPARADRPRRRVGDGRQQVRRIGTVPETPAEVGECLVGGGCRAEGQPVGDPDHPAPERLEGQRDHSGRQQRRPEAVGALTHGQAHDHDDEHVADRDQGRGQGEHQGAVHDQVDLHQTVAEHGDRDAQGHGELGEPQRQRRQPGPLDALDERHREDDQHAERQERRRGRDPQELTTLVVPRGSQAPHDGQDGGAQADGDEKHADVEQGPRHAAMAEVLSDHELAGTDGERAEDVQDESRRRDPDGPAPPRRG